MSDYLEKWCCLLIFLNNKSQERNAGTREMFQRHLIHTINVANELKCRKIVFYDDEIDNKDEWDQFTDKFTLPVDNSLTHRVNAFKYAFEKGYRKVALIENNSILLNKGHLETAFNCLKLIEFCMGQKKFNGYYLLGMNHYMPDVFPDIPLSEPLFVKSFVKEIGKHKMAMYRLPLL